MTQRYCYNFTVDYAQSPDDNPSASDFADILTTARRCVV